MQIAESPDRFISPARSMSGPGKSAVVSGTSMWLWLSMPRVVATIFATRVSVPLADHEEGERSIIPAPAVMAMAERNRRREYAACKPFMDSPLTYAVITFPAAGIDKVIEVAFGNQSDKEPGMCGISEKEAAVSGGMLLRHKLRACATGIILRPLGSPSWVPESHSFSGRPRRRPLAAKMSRA